MKFCEAYQLNIFEVESYNEIKYLLLLIEST